MSSLNLVIGPAASLAVVMMTAGLALRRHGTRHEIFLHADYAAYRGEAAANPLRFAGSIMPALRRHASGAVDRLPFLNGRTVRIEPWVAHHLVRADMSITPRELFLVTVGLMLGGGMLGMALWGTLAMTLLAALGGLALMVVYIRHRQKRRLRRFNNQLPEVLAILIIGLRAGFSITQALDAMSKQVRAPAAQEFGAAMREMRLGVSTEQALRNLAQRVRNEDLHLLINAIAIQRETGGNLITMVETIEETVRERVRIRGEVKTLTAQTTMAGWIITLLPAGLGGFMCLINPSGMSFFWTDILGMAMGGAAIFNVVLGNIVMRRITKIEL